MEPAEAGLFGKTVKFIAVKKLLPSLIKNVGKKGGEHGTKVVFEYFKKSTKNKKNVNDFIDAYAKKNPAYAKNADLFKNTLTNKLQIPNLSKPNMNLPKNGVWKGDTGNSAYWPKDVAAKSPYTKEALHKVVGKDGIVFKNGYPDFDRFRQGAVRVKGMTGIHKDDVNKAAKALVKRGDFKDVTAAKDFARNNDLAWHHEPDGKVMSLVPNIIHRNVKHDGGASFLRNSINAKKAANASRAARAAKAVSKATSKFKKGP